MTPDGMTHEEKRQWEIEEAKHLIRTGVIDLGNLVGVEEARRITKDVYKELIF